MRLDVGRRIRAHQSDGQHELHISSLGVLSFYGKFEPRRHDFMRNVRPPRKKFLAARAPHCGCARRLPCTHAHMVTAMFSSQPGFINRTFFISMRSARDTCRRHHQHSRLMRQMMRHDAMRRLLNSSCAVALQRAFLVFFSASQQAVSSPQVSATKARVACACNGRTWFH